MEREKVEFWTFGYEDGNIVINFDGQKRYIEVSPKDLKSMVSWLLLDNNTYRPDWHKGLF